MGHIAERPQLKFPTSPRRVVGEPIGKSRFISTVASDRAILCLPRTLGGCEFSPRPVRALKNQGFLEPWLTDKSARDSLAH
jgi:hypothetical protein